MFFSFSPTLQDAGKFHELFTRAPVTIVLSSVPVREGPKQQLQQQRSTSSSICQQRHKDRGDLGEGNATNLARSLVVASTCSARLSSCMSPRLCKEITVRSMPLRAGEELSQTVEKARRGTFRRLASLRPMPTANRTCAPRQNMAHTKAGEVWIITSSVEGLERRIKAQPFDLIPRHGACDEQYRCCCGQTEHRKQTPVRHQRCAWGAHASCRHPRCAIARLNRGIEAPRHARNGVDSSA